MGQFSIQYPAWTIGICLLLALASGLGLYYKSRLLSDRSFGQKLSLALLRVTAVFLILILLLNPLFKHFKQQIQKPILVFAQDISASMMPGDTQSLQAYLLERDRIENELKEKYELIHLEFGLQTVQDKTDRFLGRGSNHNSVLEYIYDYVDQQQLKGIIWATDGIYNSGKNPLYHAQSTQTPVYPILFGDTVPSKDLFISNIFHNDIIYSGDPFSVQCDLQGFHLDPGSQTNVQLSLFENGNWRNMQNQPAKITARKYFETLEFVIPTEKPGVYRYRISCSPVEGDGNLKNNNREFYVEVLDARKKVLILAHSVHPDVSALKEALNSNKNYDIEVKTVQDPPVKIEGLSLLIVHQLPGPAGSGRSLISKAQELKIPIVFILGNQTDLSQFNSIQDIAKISGQSAGSNDALPLAKAEFGPFQLSETCLQALYRFPPLSAPFGNYTLDPSAAVLFFQKIGKVETQYPLWVCSDKNGIRTSVIFGEGLWKWKMTDYLSTNSFESFYELIHKTVQFTASKNDQRQFRVHLNKRIFNEGEPLPFLAEFYNDNQERFNSPDASIAIRQSEGLNYDFNFSKTEDYYQLNTGSLPPGDYTYQARILWNGKEHLASGKFSVQNLDLEQSNRVADHEWLRLVAQRSGGKAYPPGEWNALKDELLNNPQAKPIINQNLEINPLLDRKWLFVLIFALLGLEWFLRRYWGSY
ncbi:MAG TPA: hypothetical protein VFX48_08220 [Saprospiraceae bacterium]|nr:hypothetical protein [Saprospiraceae bacterium]